MERVATMEQTRRATGAHDASYPDPIRLSRGDPVRLDGRTEEWDGWRWLWARGPDGREGWIPDDLVDSASPEPVSLEDYSAVELTVREGDVLEVLRERHGWVWCRNAAGLEGWAPERLLE